MTDSEIAAAQSPDASVATLRGLALSADVRVRALVAQHANSDCLDLLADDPRHDVRMQVALAARQLAAARWAALAVDPHISVRLAVTQNPHAPPSAITGLAVDTDPRVRFWARQHCAYREVPEDVRVMSHLMPGWPWGERDASRRAH